MAQRDPLSLRYDEHVRGLMMRAARASHSRAGVRAWIASPRGEFGRPDRGGRTAHERAFTRAAYYLIWRVPINDQKRGKGSGPEWSLKLTWGTDADRKPSARGRLARPVVVRLFPRGEARPSTPAWAGTSRQSTQGHRIDD